MTFLRTIIHICFSALQRAEIAEIFQVKDDPELWYCFSALQRAEIAEMDCQVVARTLADIRFSALQRAEIAEIQRRRPAYVVTYPSFSALQRAEIAEIAHTSSHASASATFQCSSTSRNC